MTGEKLILFAAVCEGGSKHNACPSLITTGLIVEATQSILKWIQKSKSSQSSS